MGPSVIRAGRINTRWWPPFCLVVDFTAAAILAAAIVAGAEFHH
jgi:hypothetical protein